MRSNNLSSGAGSSSQSTSVSNSSSTLCVPPSSPAHKRKCKSRFPFSSTRKGKYPLRPNNRENTPSPQEDSANAALLKALEEASLRLPDTQPHPALEPSSGVLELTEVSHTTRLRLRQQTTSQSSYDKRDNGSRASNDSGGDLKKVQEVGGRRRPPVHGSRDQKGVRDVGGGSGAPDGVGGDWKRVYGVSGGSRTPADCDGNQNRVRELGGGSRAPIYSSGDRKRVREVDRGSKAPSGSGGDRKRVHEVGWPSGAKKAESVVNSASSSPSFSPVCLKGLSAMQQASLKLPDLQCKGETTVHATATTTGDSRQVITETPWLAIRAPSLPKSVTPCLRSRASHNPCSDDSRFRKPVSSVNTKHKNDVSVMGHSVNVCVVEETPLITNAPTSPLYGKDSAGPLLVSLPAAYFGKSLRTVSKCVGETPLITTVNEISEGGHGDTLCDMVLGEGMNGKGNDCESAACTCISIQEDTGEEVSTVTPCHEVHTPTLSPSLPLHILSPRTPSPPLHIPSPHTPTVSPSPPPHIPRPHTPTVFPSTPPHILSPHTPTASPSPPQHIPSPHATTVSPSPSASQITTLPDSTSSLPHPHSKQPLSFSSKTLQIPSFPDHQQTEQTPSKPHRHPLPGLRSATTPPDLVRGRSPLSSSSSPSMSASLVIMKRNPLTTPLLSQSSHRTISTAAEESVLSSVNAQPPSQETTSLSPCIPLQGGRKRSVCRHLLQDHTESNQANCHYLPSDSDEESCATKLMNKHGNVTSNFTVTDTIVCSSQLSPEASQTLLPAHQAPDHMLPGLTARFHAVTSLAKPLVVPDSLCSPCDDDAHPAVNTPMTLGSRDEVMAAHCESHIASSSSSSSQGLTLSTQDLEVLKIRMEQKQREIEVLEALLLKEDATESAAETAVTVGKDNLQNEVVVIPESIPNHTPLSPHDHTHVSDMATSPTTSDATTISHTLASPQTYIAEMVSINPQQLTEDKEGKEREEGEEECEEEEEKGKEEERWEEGRDSEVMECVQLQGADARTILETPNVAMKTPADLAAALTSQSPEQVESILKDTCIQQSVEAAPPSFPWSSTSSCTSSKSTGRRQTVSQRVRAVLTSSDHSGFTCERNKDSAGKISSAKSKMSAVRCKNFHSSHKSSLPNHHSSSSVSPRLLQLADKLLKSLRSPVVVVTDEQTCINVDKDFVAPASISQSTKHHHSRSLYPTLLDTAQCQSSISSRSKTQSVPPKRRQANQVFRETTKSKATPHRSSAHRKPENTSGRAHLGGLGKSSFLQQKLDFLHGKSTHSTVQSCTATQSSKKKTTQIISLDSEDSDTEAPPAVSTTRLPDDHPFLSVSISTDPPTRNQGIIKTENYPLVVTPNQQGGTNVSATTPEGVDKKQKSVSHQKSVSDQEEVTCSINQGRQPAQRVNSPEKVRNHPREVDTSVTAAGNPSPHEGSGGGIGCCGVGSIGGGDGSDRGGDGGGDTNRLLRQSPVLCQMHFKASPSLLPHPSTPSTAASGSRCVPAWSGTTRPSFLASCLSNAQLVRFRLFNIVYNVHVNVLT